LFPRDSVYAANPGILANARNIAVRRDLDAVSDYDGIINVVTGLPGNQGISCGDELLGNPVHARRRCPEELAVERYRLRCDRFHSFPARSRVNILRTKSQKPMRLPLKRSRRSPQSAGAILRTMSLATLRRTTQFSLTGRVSVYQTRHCCLTHASTRKRTQTRAYRVSPRATGFHGNHALAQNLTGPLQPIRRPSAVSWQVDRRN
jgi:hypothetical protein